MKKSLVLGILGVAAATVAYGQGTVQFGNYYSSTAPTINYAASNVPIGKAGLAVGGNFAAELAWFNGTTSDSTQLTALPGTITGFGEVFGPAYPNATPDGGLGAGWWGPSTVALTGTAANQVVTLEVLVFNGTSFADPTTTVNGHSTLFQYSLGGGVVSPPSFNGLMPNFTVQNVPEPSLFALAGLGAAGLMALRRKKA